MYHFPYTISDMNELGFPEPVDFEWDQYNQAKIQLKHGITAKEAEQVLLNSPIIDFDILHSSSEQRFKILGANNAGEVLFIALTIRGSKVRVISARKANKKERELYAKQI